MRLLRPRDFHMYQRRAIDHQINNPHSLLFLFLGSGKTAITLTTINHLITNGYIRSALIMAPLRVCQAVWRQEAGKWSHLQHMTFSLIHGTAQERLRALTRPANVYLINYENVRWMCDQLQHHYIRKGYHLPFDMMVADECSKLKNSTSQRVEALKPLIPYFKWRTGLTGTPAANGLIDLHGQLLVIDGGERLGINISDYKANYFRQAGQGGYSYEPTAVGEKAIHRRIADITLEMSEEEYLTLPPFVVYDINVELPPRAREQYDQMEKDFFAELDNGEVVEVESAAAKCNKVIQISNGSVYTDTETKAWSPVHDAKLEALDEIIEEAAGEPILLGYNFRPDAARIKKKFPYAVNMTGMSANQFNQAIVDFQQGRIRLLIGHPASIGHGIDGLQKRGGIIAWFGIPWSLELYLQLNKRIHRQGQGKPVRCYRILGTDTMDQAVAMALEHKATTQSALRAAIKQYREERGL